MRAKRVTADESVDGVPGPGLAGTGSDPGPAGAGPRHGRSTGSRPPYLDEDIRAIGELLARIRSLWDGLTTPAREDLTARLELLSDAVDRRDPDSRAVRTALQQVLLYVGTGALTTLSDGVRQRLAALTGISLPGERGMR